MDNKETFMGPYRATKLWNSIISSFRTSMPIGRHRRYMRTYENCFVASDAVFWLHRYLRDNPNFGSDVSRVQTIQLLQKFLKSKVFEDVRGGNDCSGDFGDNGKLYRFTHTSPVRSKKSPFPVKKMSLLKRTPLGIRTNTLNQVGRTPAEKIACDMTKPVSSVPEVGLPEVRLVARQLSQTGIEHEYKTATLNSLKRLLHLGDIEDILDAAEVEGKDILHNMTFVTKGGMVTNIDPDKQLPNWVLSAMKCLANWPNSTGENLPNYRGFEKDVFKVVQGYFQALEEPLLTYKLYDVFTEVLVIAEEIEYENRGLKTDNSSGSTLPSFSSVENLMMDLTMNAPISPFNIRVSNRSASRTPEMNSQDEYELGTDAMYNYNGMPSKPNSGYVRKRNKKVIHGGSSPSKRRCHDDFHSRSRHNNALPTARDYTGRDQVTSNLKNSQRFYSVPNVNDVGICENKLRTQYSTNTNDTYKSNHRVTTTFSSSTYSIASCGTLESDVFYPEGKQPRDSATRRRTTENIPNRIAQRGNFEGQRALPKYQSPPHYSILYDNSDHTPVLDGSNRDTHDYSNSRTGYMPSSHGDREFTSKRSTSGIPACITRSSKNLMSAASPRSGSGYPICSEGDPPRSLSRGHVKRDSGASIDSELKRYGSYSSLLSEGSLSVLQDSLQLCCLLLPPKSRRKLHLLLRLMSKMSDNDDLILDPIVHIRSLVIQTFSRSILCSRDECDLDELLTFRLVTFMMDNCEAILTVPPKLKGQIEERLAHLKRAQIKYCIDDGTVPLSYCEQVSVATYENQKLSTSQSALSELLENIVTDKTMSHKDKKSKLKRFQKAYPELYHKRFPTPQSEAVLFPPKQPKIKQPLLQNLARPLKKLKSLRL